MTLLLGAVALGLLVACLCLWSALQTAQERLEDARRSRRMWREAAINFIERRGRDN